jgi:hypothetical protein
MFPDANPSIAHQYLGMLYGSFRIIFASAETHHSASSLTSAQSRLSIAGNSGDVGQGWEAFLDSQCYVARPAMHQCILPMR